MSRRRGRPRPPTSPGYESGQVLTFSASDDVYPPSGRMVELKPVGPPPLVLELRSEDEQVTPAEPGKPPPAPKEPTA